MSDGGLQTHRVNSWSYNSTNVFRTSGGHLPDRVAGRELPLFHLRVDLSPLSAAWLLGLLCLGVGELCM